MNIVDQSHNDSEVWNKLTMGLTHDIAYSFILHLSIYAVQLNLKDNFDGSLFQVDWQGFLSNLFHLWLLICKLFKVCPWPEPSKKQGDFNSKKALWCASDIVPSRQSIIYLIFSPWQRRRRDNIYTLWNAWEPPLYSSSLYPVQSRTAQSTQ